EAVPKGQERDVLHAEPCTEEHGTVGVDGVVADRPQEVRERWEDALLIAGATAWHAFARLSNSRACRSSRKRTSCAGSSPMRGALSCSLAPASARSQASRISAAPAASGRATRRSIFPNSSPPKKRGARRGGANSRPTRPCSQRSPIAVTVRWP